MNCLYSSVQTIESSALCRQLHPVCRFTDNSIAPVQLRAMEESLSAMKDVLEDETREKERLLAQLRDTQARDPPSKCTLVLGMQPRV